MDELLDLLRNVKPGVDFESEENLVDDGILNSIDVISIIAEIQDRFGVTIPSDEIIPENFNSAKAMKDLLDDLM